MRTRLSATALSHQLALRVEEISGENLFKCYQCGMCAAGCPAAFAMDMLPSRAIRLLQLGLAEEVLDSDTPWYCAACQTCYARCPKGLDLSRIMEAIREIAIQERGDFRDLAGLSPRELAELPQQAFIAYFRKYTA